MSEITVRALTEDEWETYRTLRLEALQESPDAFVADHATEAAEPEDFWRARMDRSVRLVAVFAHGIGLRAGDFQLNGTFVDAARNLQA